MLAEGGSSLFKRNGGWQQWARWRAWAALSALAMVVAPARIAWAHGGQPLAPHDLWRAWNLAPSLWLGLGLSAWLYARRIRVLAQRRLRPPALRSACFVAGLLAAFVALVSPLDAQASVLFAAHMAQHMLLVLVAAPLVALSRPLGPTLLGLPKGPRRAPGRGWQAAVLWAWHVPGLYQAALRHPLAHGLEHLSLAGTALLFWWSALWPSRRAGPNYGASVLGLFATLMLGSPLGALLTLSPRPWYADDANTTAAWGLTPLEDQQLAGVVMWVPATLVYVEAALGVLAVWLGQMERRDVQKAQRVPPLSEARAKR